MSLINVFKSLAMNAKNECIYRVQRAKIYVEPNKEPDVDFCVWTYLPSCYVPKIRTLKNVNVTHETTRVLNHSSVIK